MHKYRAKNSVHVNRSIFVKTKYWGIDAIASQKHCFSDSWKGEAIQKMTVIYSRGNVMHSLASSVNHNQKVLPEFIVYRKCTKTNWTAWFWKEISRFFLRINVCSFLLFRLLWSGFSCTICRVGLQCSLWPGFKNGKM